MKGWESVGLSPMVVELRRSIRAWRGNIAVWYVSLFHSEKVYACNGAPNCNAYSEQPKTSGDIARESTRKVLSQNQRGGQDG